MKNVLKKIIFLIVSLFVFTQFCFSADGESDDLQETESEVQIYNLPQTDIPESEDEKTLTEKARLDVSFEELAETSSVKNNLDEENNFENDADAESESNLVTEIIEDKIESDEDIPEDEKAAIGGIAEVPAPKRPKKVDKQKADAAREKDESKEDEENNRKIIQYGIPSEIGELLDTLIKNEDPRYTEDIYDLFQTAVNSSIKEKVIRYFTKIEDPCLEDFAVNLVNDPYDEKKEVVSATFKYIQTVKTTAAIPAIITLLESENEDYFNDSLATIGELGGKREAKFIAEYLDRDDLTDAQRQTLMRTLGKMKALNTWSKVTEILEDEDENSFVRMYAAEALGLMEKKEAVPLLVRNYSASDPNIRQYVVKGLSYFPDVVEARATIVQAVRDEHWKVRQEAINTCKDKEFKDAVPFLIFRADKDSEKIIKNASIEAIGKLNTKEGNEFLVGKVTDKKAGDGTKQKVVEVLLKEGHAGQKEILELADSCVDDDKKKNLRYAIGKELAKNAKPEFEEICSKYLASKDTTTIGIGLDMYKNCRFKSCEAQMMTIVQDKKANSSIKNRIRKLLDLPEEDPEETKK